MIRRRQKSCKEGVCSIQCFPHTRRCCACFSDYVHTSRIQGYLHSGGMYFRGIATTANFSKNWRGTYFRRGTYLRGFTVPFLFLKTTRATKASPRTPIVLPTPAATPEELLDFAAPDSGLRLALLLSFWTLTPPGLRSPLLLLSRTMTPAKSEHGIEHHGDRVPDWWKTFMMCVCVRSS